MIPNREGLPKFKARTAMRGFDVPSSLPFRLADVILRRNGGNEEKAR